MSEPSALEQAIIGYWGERCPDHDANCRTCQAWAQFAAIRDLQERLARAEEWSGKRAEDIVTLGALVYADENTTWKERALAAERERDEAVGVCQFVVDTVIQGRGTEEQQLDRLYDAARAFLSTLEPKP